MLYPGYLYKSIHGMLRDHSSYSSLTCRRPLLQLRLNRALQRLRLCRAGPPIDYVSILADQKLLKVPLDGLDAHYARLLRLHPLVDGIRAFAVDFYLVEDGERHAVVDPAEFLDFVDGARFLVAELVAREAEDFELI